MCLSTSSKSCFCREEARSSQGPVRFSTWSLEGIKSVLCCKQTEKPDSVLWPWKYQNCTEAQRKMWKVLFSGSETSFNKVTEENQHLSGFNCVCWIHVTNNLIVSMSSCSSYILNWLFFCNKISQELLDGLPPNLMDRISPLKTTLEFGVNPDLRADMFTDSAGSNSWILKWVREIWCSLKWRI